MASVAFVTTEHDEARPSPAKLPQEPGRLQGVRSTESPTGFTPPVNRWPGACKTRGHRGADLTRTWSWKKTGNWQLAIRQATLLVPAPRAPVSGANA